MACLKSLPALAMNDIRIRLKAGINPNAKLEILAIGTPASLISGYTTAYNTAMLVRVDEAYRQWVVYNRLDAATYYNNFFNATTRARGMVFTTPATTVYEALADINRYLATDFTESEVYNDALVAGATTLPVRFTANSRWFTGSMSVPIEGNSQVANSKVYAKATYTPNLLRGTLRTTNVINPGLLTYDKDYESATATLIGIGMSAYMYYTTGGGYADATTTANIASILAAKDGLPWVSSSTASEFNLYQSYVLYNGDTLAMDIEFCMNLDSTSIQNDTQGLNIRELKFPRTERRYVMVVMLNPTYCNNLNRDLLYIHYGPVVNGTARAAKIDKPPVHHWPLQNNYRNFGTDPGKVDCALRGEFGSRVTDGKAGLWVNKNFPTIWPNTAIGARLYIDRDFTFSFYSMTGSPDTVPGSMYWQFYDGGLSNTIGRLVVNADGNWCIQGSTHQVNGYESGKSWPYPVLVTVVREGDEWSIYHDGMLRSVFRSLAITTKYWDTLYQATTEYLYISDIKYFDYALNPLQVRRLAKLDPAFAGTAFKQDATLPTPRNHFPLKTDAKDKITGAVLTTDIIFTNLTIESRSTPFAKNTTNMQYKPLGVTFPRAGDFTLQFDYYGDSQNSLYIFCEGASAGTSPSGLFTGYDCNTMFFRSGVHDSVTSELCYYYDRAGIPAGIAVTWTIVKRGTVCYFYAGNKFIHAQGLMDGYTMKPFAYWFTSTSRYIRHLKYWDIALNSAQIETSLKEPV